MTTIDKLAMKRKRDTRCEPQREPDAMPGIPPHVLRFLNGLPVIQDMMEQIKGCKEALRELLGDVDRIALFINIDCDLLLTERWNGREDMLMIVESASPQYPEQINLGVNVIRTEHLIQSYLDHLRQVQFPFSQYHPPASFLYSLCADGNHLGMIGLFRKKKSPAIAASTLEFMERLRPFLLFLLSHLVAQNEYIRRRDIVFHDTMDDLVYHLDLTARQREILALRLMGDQKKTIAGRLFLSQETLSKHIQNILRKGKARSLIELFMRYYIQRLEGRSDVDFDTIVPPQQSPAEPSGKARHEKPAGLPQRKILIW